MYFSFVNLYITLRKQKTMATIVRQRGSPPQVFRSALEQEVIEYLTRMGDAHTIFTNSSKAYLSSCSGDSAVVFHLIDEMYGGRDFRYNLPTCQVVCMKNPSQTGPTLMHLARLEKEVAIKHRGFSMLDISSRLGLYYPDGKLHQAILSGRLNRQNAEEFISSMMSELQKPAALELVNGILDGLVLENPSKRMDRSAFRDMTSPWGHAVALIEIPDSQQTPDGRNTRVMADYATLQFLQSGGNYPLFTRGFLLLRADEDTLARHGYIRFQEDPQKMVYTTREQAIQQHYNLFNSKPPSNLDTHAREIMEVAIRRSK
ncbi:MAG: hypothetical protein V1703_00350 [Candidatus Altiarchaeota archaeon]